MITQISSMVRTGAVAVERGYITALLARQELKYMRLATMRCAQPIECDAPRKMRDQARSIHSTLRRSKIYSTGSLGQRAYRKSPGGQ